MLEYPLQRPDGLCKWARKRSPGVLSAFHAAITSRCAYNRFLQNTRSMRGTFRGHQAGVKGAWKTRMLSAGDGLPWWLHGPRPAQDRGRHV